jgi:aspartate-semialdehyde dehydrogenase
MLEKLSVGVLGATGLLGQTYVHLLSNHPWFSLEFVSSSQKGSYRDAVKNSWLYSSSPPNLSLASYDAKPNPKLLFSTLCAEKAQELEPQLAKEGYFIISHASCFRSDPLIPLILAEINPHHLDVLPLQQKQKRWKGWILSKPNCTLPSFILPLFPFIESHNLLTLHLTTLQSRSGAGIQALDAKTPYEDVVPHIFGEEHKTENEPLKILGKVTSKGIQPNQEISISAHCTRVSIPYGHLATVHAHFEKELPIAEVKKRLRTFKPLDLPSSPKDLFLLEENPAFPQPSLIAPKLSMEVAVGNIRPDLRFTGLSHNVIRGGSGGGLLIAELLHTKGLLNET